MGLPYAEYRRRQDAVMAVAQAMAEARAEEWTRATVEQERERAVVIGRATLWSGAGLRGRTPRQAVICPARMVAGSPDPKLRQLGREQAAESHAVWGACCPCRRGFVPAWTVTPKSER